jgi:hypothetical protein
VDISLLALWFVCGLGTAVFAAAAPRTRPAVVVAVGAFAIGAWWIRQPFAPTTSAVAVAAALIGAAELIRERRPVLVLGTAGLLAGIWTGVLEFQGAPTVAAIAVACAVPVGSAFLRGRRPAFAPPQLREEALLFIVILGVIAGAAPGITEGWRAATNLNLQGGEVERDVAMPLWTLAVASAALLSGGLFSLWSRR